MPIDLPEASVPGRLEALSSPRLVAELSGSGLDVQPRAKLVLFRAGNGGNLAAVSPELRAALDESFSRGEGLARHRAWLAACPPSALPQAFSPSGSAAARLFLFWFSSLGHELDEAVSTDFAQGHPLRGALLDAWGSESLEAFNESIHEALRARALSAGWAPLKLGTVERFSPGYGEVSVLANADFYSLLAEELLLRAPGLSVSPQTGIMLPRKSTLCVLAFS
jgi:hypothetical protein